MFSQTSQSISVPRQKSVLLPRRRAVLHRLLNGEQRRCSVSALEALRRCGWILGPEAAYQFTEKGRAIAELSEAAPQNRPLEIDICPAGDCHMPCDSPDVRSSFNDRGK